MRNEYDRWIKIAMPWALFSGMILGLGIMLGGYWAYGVLGWGGYWGWDPVENSSLVPWVIIVAAIHTMVSGLTNGKFKRSSLLLCILAYIMVLYSTFLTRSGILGDASVHSFVDPGQEVYLFLVVFLSLFGTGAIALLISRLKHLKSQKSDAVDILSKESALFIGTITLCATALVIAIGTSWPIFAKGTVDPSFYNKMNLPLAILIAAINGFSMLLKWKHSDEKQFIKSLYVPIGLTAAAAIVMIYFGLNDILIGIFAAASFFAFFINVESAYRIIVNRTSKTGAYIAHLGIMVLFLGVIGSAKYSEEVNISLPIGEPRQALGYTLTYLRATEIPGEHDKYHFNIAVEKDGSVILLQPIMFYSEYSQGIMKNPDYAPLPTKDIYIEPMALEVPDKFAKEDLVMLSKGETKEAKGLNVKFIEVSEAPMSGKHDHENEMGDKVGVKLEVTSGGKTETVIAEQKITEGNQEPIPVHLASSDRYTFYLGGLSVEGETKINLAVVDETLPKIEQPAETLVVTAAVKPFISLVWIGTLIMVIGFFISMLNRYKKMHRESLKLSNVTVNGQTNVHKKHAVKQKA
jgi:cytochrome c-type biogenesis protein CcmF